METVEREYEEIEKALGDMPEGLYAIAANYDGETEFLFARVDADGGWEGSLDTKHVSFEDEDEMQAEFRRVLHEEAVVL